MRKTASYLVLSTIVLMPVVESKLHADAAESTSSIESAEEQTQNQPTDEPELPKPAEEPSQTQQVSPKAVPESSVSMKKRVTKTPEAPFAAFTGKITKNKVRMRFQPSLDSQVLRELSRDSLVIVMGENDEFYAVQAPQDIKGFVFRKFILDNKVEGEHVNVRMEPNTDAPIIAQLNSGEPINGTISSINSKWIEIAPPASTRFYISKEYIEKLGPPELMGQIEKRRQEVNDLLNKAYTTSQEELKKDFKEINLNSITSNYKKVIDNYSDFPEQAARAKELMAALQDTYTQKKVAYLEAKAQASESLQALNSKLAKTVQTQESSESTPSDDQESYIAVTAKMNSWLPLETHLFNEWAGNHTGQGMEEYYQDQKENAVALTGIIEPYTRNVKNKPGDYLLINPATRLPIAYLYSTQVNLQDKVGNQVSLLAAPRPNNNFAFPAYYVIIAK